MTFFSPSVFFNVLGAIITLGILYVVTKSHWPVQSESGI
jgi:hypothetical protein